jgi:hypothetical protein
MRNLRDRITYANVVSTLALVIALGMGSAYAANQLAPKSVGAPQLRPGAVTADKIRKKAVTAPKIESLAVKQGKIAAGAIVTSKLADGTVTTAKIATGAIAPDKIPNDSLTGEKINEGSLGQVPSASTANFATAAETANPEAFAKVDAEGTVFPANSKGIGTADVRQGKDPGTYCVNVPGFVPRGAQATPEFSAHASVTIFVKLGGTESCPNSHQAEVRTYSLGNPSKEPFFIMLYR